MKRIHRIRALIVAIITAFLPIAATAYPISQQHVYVNGDVLTPTILNPNIATIVTWANGGVEHVNIGPLGIYATDVKPTSPLQATFTGAWGWTVTDTTTGQVTFTVNAPSGQSVDIADFNLNSVTKVSIDSAGGLHGTTAAFTGALSAVGVAAGGAITGATTINASGVITGSQFNGSGAGLTSGTVPNAALVTTPVTSVTASGNLASSGGTTPAITITATPTFTGATISGLTASAPLCVGASSVLTSTCNAINYTFLNIGLGFAPGALSTGTVYPYQQVPGYTAGTISKIRVACATADGGTTVIHVLDNGADITSSPYTLAAATTSTFSITPYTLVAGHILHMTVTTAGTATSCGVTAEGQQSLV